MEDIKFIEQRILQLLADTPYELCARLKQRLNQSLHREGYTLFSERDYGHRKFAEFLKARLSESVHLELPVTTGDIRVSLKTPLVQTDQSIAPSRERPSNIRLDMWQAFINPDPKRRRFFNRLDHRVLHFVEDSGDEYERKWAENAQDYVEIQFLDSDAQVGWMRQFIELVAPDEQDRQAIDELLKSSFSSGVNTAFTKMLGSRAEEWRKLLKVKVVEHILTWAAQHTINPQDLSPKTKRETSPQAPVEQLVAGAVLSARQQAIRLLDLMSDDEIAKVAIPVLLSSVLSNSKL